MATAVVSTGPEESSSRDWLQRLGVERPILQAPMAGSQGSALAVAVSEAGGLGALPAAMLSPQALHEELTRITRATRRPYNVNFFAHTPPTPDAQREAAWRAVLAPYFAEFGLDEADIAPGAWRRPFDAEAAAVLEPFRPPVVSFHFGLPEPALLARVKAWGAQVLSTATTVAEARWLEAHGADVVIAQGLEAGGHRGMFLSEDLDTQLGSLALVSQIRQAVRLPVVAAGGIADAQAVTAVLALGACAAQVGTAYLCCPEATTSPVHRRALLADPEAPTALTRLFSGRPARGLVNRLMRELGPLHAAAPAFPLASAALAPLRARAEAQGLGDFSPLWAGQNRRGCCEQPAGELTRRLAGG